MRQNEQRKEVEYIRNALAIQDNMAQMQPQIAQNEENIEEIDIDPENQETVGIRNPNKMDFENSK